MYGHWDGKLTLIFRVCKYYKKCPPMGGPKTGTLICLAICVNACRNNNCKDESGSPISYNKIKCVSMCRAYRHRRSLLFFRLWCSASKSKRMSDNTSSECFCGGGGSRDRSIVPASCLHLAIVGVRIPSRRLRLAMRKWAIVCFFKVRTTNLTLWWRWTWQLSSITMLSVYVIYATWDA